METVDPVEWEDFVATNLTAPFLLSKACIPMLKKRAEGEGEGDGSGEGGCIVHMSSTRETERTQ